MLEGLTKNVILGNPAVLPLNVGRTRWLCLPAIFSEQARLPIWQAGAPLFPDPPQVGARQKAWRPCGDSSRQNMAGEGLLFSIIPCVLKDQRYLIQIYIILSNIQVF